MQICAENRRGPGIVGNMWRGEEKELSEKEKLSEKK